MFFPLYAKKNPMCARCSSVTQPEKAFCNVSKTSYLILMCLCVGSNEEEQLFVAWVLFCLLAVWWIGVLVKKD